MQPVGVIVAPSGEVLVDDKQLAQKCYLEISAGKFRPENSEYEIRFN
ncbi:hypothetical protein HED55_20230 [Ochrobactrum haematophilum]|uniref:Uncharacterized protein n=1 Tax=Brucella haematophila TaxID=419474 RepID=A0ABX1DP15_9HYPH|nr:hypothetical protein [Brucella haematophila]